mgnify:CR=1 FL=1
MKAKRRLSLLFTICLVISMLSVSCFADEYQSDVSEGLSLSTTEIVLAGQPIEVPIIRYEKQVFPADTYVQHANDNVTYMESTEILLVPELTEEALSNNLQVVSKIKQGGVVVPYADKLDPTVISVVDGYVWCYSYLKYSYTNKGSERYYDVEYFKIDVNYESMVPFEGAVEISARLNQVGAIEGESSWPAQTYDVSNVQSGTRYYAPNWWKPCQNNSFADVGVVYTFAIDYTDSWPENDTSFSFRHTVS